MVEFTPIYKEIKNLADVNHNQQQMIQAFNHGMTKLGDSMENLSCASIKQGQDIMWMKRAVFAICGLFGAVVLAGICEMLGWLPA